MAGVFTARCPGKEGPNEDAAVVIPIDDQRGILAVADGFGGQPAGHTAARIAIEAIVKCLKNVPEDEQDLREGILNSFEAANKAVAELSVGAATTLAVLEIQADTIRPYHVGDSMILVMGQRGKIKLQTVSHSPVGYAVEAGLLGEKEAMEHEDRHLVSNMVGAEDMRIEIGPVLAISPHDTVLLASDGVADNLHVEEIVARARKGSLTEVIRSIAVAASRRMREPNGKHPSKPDDVTFIAYRRTQGPQPKSRHNAKKRN
jgi:serine/threonine protein phosphatase PrpC